MKKIFSILLAYALLLGTAACSSSETTNPEASVENTSSFSTASSDTSEAAPTPEPVTEEEKEEVQEILENDKIPDKVEEETTVEVDGNKVTIKPDGSKEIETEDGETIEVKPDGSINKPVPTPSPTASATVKPSEKPSEKPTVKPTAKPTVKPTMKPTAKPTAKPTEKPTPKPTKKPVPAELKPYMPPFDKSAIRQDAIDYMLSSYPKAELHTEFTTSNSSFYPPICTYDFHFEQKTHEEKIISAGYLRRDVYDDCDYIGAEAAGGSFYFNIVVEDYDNDNIRVYVLYG